jgi:hypothetical protein
MDLRKISSKDEMWMELTQDRLHCLVLDVSDVENSGSITGELVCYSTFALCWNIDVTRKHSVDFSSCIGEGSGNRINRTLGVS